MHLCIKCGCKPPSVKGLCRRCYYIAYYKKHREKILNRSREYQQSNRDKRTEYRRKYRSTEGGKKATQEAVRKYEKKNRGKRRAWNRAKGLGNLFCEVCGKETAHKHHINYDKPFDVNYLCPLHHKQRHLNKV